MKNEKRYLLTDGCFWEKNKKEGTFHTHAIEVVEVETGNIQYITSGSYITFVKGKITDRSQKAYNKATSEEDKKVLRNGQRLPQRKESETTGPEDN